MDTVSERLTIELPRNEALAVYRRRLLLILGIGIGNLILLGLVLLLCATSLGAIILAAMATLAANVAAFLAAVGGFLASTGSAALTGIAIFLVKHWVLSIAAVVVVFLITITRRRVR